jgi:uncharacterized protein
MVIPDINLLIYAYNAAASLHERARRWWEELLSSDTPVGIPWVVPQGFIRLMTHRAVLRDPWPVAECTGRVDEWFAAPNVISLEPGPRHLMLLSTLLAAAGTGGNLVTDAHLAALAIEHNAELHSNDTDFARFSGLRLVNPIAATH